MRWPFFRKDPAADHTPASGPRSAEWTDLPPIQRTVGPALLTIPPDFGPQLAAHQNPQLTLAPLGHRVSLEGPHGMVLGLATPVASRVDGPELIPRKRVQRRTPDHTEQPPAGSPDAALVWHLDAVETVDAPDPFRSQPLTTVVTESRIEPVRSIPLMTAPLAAAASPTKPPESPKSEALSSPLPRPRLTLGQTRRLGLGAPLSHAPTVQRAAEPPAETSPPADDEPAQVIQPSPREIMSAAAAGPAPVEPQPFDEDPPATRRDGAAEDTVRPLSGRLGPPLRTSWPSPQEDTSQSLHEVPMDLTLAAPGGPAEPPVPSPRPPAGEGIEGRGTVSMDARSPAAKVTPTTLQRSAEVADGPAPEAPNPGPAADAVATIARPFLPLSATQGIQPVAPSEDPGPEGGQQPSRPDMPLRLTPALVGAPTAGTADTSDTYSTSEAHPAPGREDAASHANVQTSRGALTESGAHSSERVAPLSGFRPLTQAYSVQRSVEGVPPGVQSRMRERVGVNAGETRIHRGEAAGEEVRRLGARAFTQGTEIYLPAEAGPLESVRTQALLAHELTHVSQQRQLGSSLPSESSPMGARLEEDARRVERSWQADASLPLAASRRASPAVPQEVSSGARASVSAGAPGGSTIDDFDPTNMSFSAGPLQMASSEMAAVQSPSGGSSPASGGTAPSASTDGELDELARKLYERIRSRIRGELLIDRERAGMLTDLR